MLSTPIAFAQRYPQGQGTFRTNGGLSISPVESSGELKKYRINLTPSLGYFFTDEALVGIALNYASTVGLGYYDGSLRISPQTKYYFTISKGTFIIANFNYNFEIATDKTDDVQEIEDNSGVSFGPGISYFFSRRIGIEATLLYTTYFFPDENHKPKFNFGMGFSLNLPSKKKKDF